VRIAVASAVACLCVAGFSVASDVKASIKMPTDISAQGLGPALRTLAKNRDFQIVYRSELVSNLRTAGASGNLTSTEALTQLLEGTDLVFTYIDQQTVSIVPRAELPPQPSGDVSELSVAPAPTQRSDPGTNRSARNRNLWSRFRLAQADQGTVAGGPATGADRQSHRGQDGEPDSRQRIVLEEIVVTANKRVENVQNVAASVSVQSGDQLMARSQEQLTDYAAYMPGFYVNNGGSAGQASVVLRGISSVTSSSAVAAYLDETPLGSSSNWNNASVQMLDILPYDLDRLEVLRGPQGTLYGAGSMGGLIKYVLKSPSTSEFEGKIGADVSAIDGAGQSGYDVHGRINVPLVSDVLGVSISLFDKHMPGYIDNAYTGADDTNEAKTYGGRIAALWQPTQDLSVKLSWLEYRSDSDDNAWESFGTVTSVPSTNGAVIVKAFNSFGDLTQNHAYPQLFHKDLSYGALTLDWDAGPVNVISATGYSKQTTNVSQDFTIQYGSLPTLFGQQAGLSAGRFDYGIEKFTQELRVVSAPAEHFDWIVGGFYTHERSTDDQYGLIYDTNNQLNPTFAPYFYEGHLPTTYSEIALFGDLTWKLSDRFDVTGGVRSARNTQNFANFTGGALAAAPGWVVAPEAKESVTTWSFDSRYHFTVDDMLYARIAKGYRPGSPNNPIAGIPPTVGADTLINYEVGVKSQFLDQRALLNVSVFWIDWSDIQLAAVQNGFGYFANGGDATSKGFELTSAWSPIQPLSLGFNAAYTKSELTSVISGTPFMAGYQLPYVPEWSFSLTADYEWELQNGWNAQVGGGYRWLDKVWLGSVQSGPFASPSVQAPSYSVLDFNANVRNGAMAFKLYARNLTNKRAFQGATQGATVASDAILGGAKQADFPILQPRTVGIGVDYSF
jgi:outer membrane receptor protein involved in Fe transport